MYGVTQMQNHGNGNKQFNLQLVFNLGNEIVIFFSFVKSNKWCRISLCRVTWMSKRMSYLLGRYCTYCMNALFYIKVLYLNFFNIHLNIILKTVADYKIFGKLYWIWSYIFISYSCFPLHFFVYHADIACWITSLLFLQLNSKEVPKHILLY